MAVPRACAASQPGDAPTGSSGTINAVANVRGRAASMGEGAIVGVLTQLVKSFSANVAQA